MKHSLHRLCILYPGLPRIAYLTPLTPLVEERRGILFLLASAAAATRRGGVWRLDRERSAIWTGANALFGRLLYGFAISIS